MTTPGYPGSPSANDPQEPTAGSADQPPSPYGQQPPSPQPPAPPAPPAYGDQPQPPTYAQQPPAPQPPAPGQYPQDGRPPAPGYPSLPGQYAQPGQPGQTVVDRFKAEAANRPTTIVAGCITLAASAVVFGIWYAIMLIMALADPFVAGGLALLDTFSGGAVTGMVIVMLILTLATIGLSLVAAWQVWNGSNAWRITGLVLGILMAVYNLFLLFGGAIALGLLAFLASVAVIVLWFLTPSNLWFNARKPQIYGGPQPPMQY